MILPFLAFFIPTLAGATDAPWKYDAGLGFAINTYGQDYSSDLKDGALDLRLGANYRLTPLVDFRAQSTISNSLFGMNTNYAALRFYDFYVAANYLTAWQFGQATHQLSLGIFASTTSGNSIGYDNVMGPDFGWTAARTFENKRSLTMTLHFAPILSKAFSFSKDRRYEIAAEYFFLENENHSRFSIGLSYSHLDFETSDGLNSKTSRLASILVYHFQTATEDSKIQESPKLQPGLTQPIPTAQE